MSETITPPNGNIQRFRLNKWRQRYALIEDNKYLCVYTEKTKKKLEDDGKIDITHSKMKVIPQSREFQIDTKKLQTSKKYFFQCDTRSDAENWVQYLQQIKNNKQTGARRSISDEEKEMQPNGSNVMNINPSLDEENFKIASDLYNVVLTPKSQKMRAHTMFIAPSKIHSPLYYPNTHVSEEKSIQKQRKSRPDKVINYASIATPNSPNPDGSTFPPTVSAMFNNIATSTIQEEELPIIDKIDVALEKYYSYFPNAVYRNGDNIGKFKAFCEEQLYDNNDDIKKELDDNFLSPGDCALITFDEDEESEMNMFPLELTIDDEKRNGEIFKVIHHCFIHGTPPHPLFQFEKDDFYYVMEPFKRKGKSDKNDNKSEKSVFSITMKAKSEFMKQTETGLELNLTKSDDCMIQIKNLNQCLRELIGISMHADNSLFKYDFASLLIDSYHRYCIIKEINIEKNKLKGPYIGSILNAMSNNQDIGTWFVLRFKQYLSVEEYDTDAILADIGNENSDINYEQSNIFENNKEIKAVIGKYVYNEINSSIESQGNKFTEIYGQMYWFAKSGNIIKRRKVVSSVQSQLEAAFEVVRDKNDTRGIVLMVNGKMMKHSDDKEAIELHKIGINDYNDIIFRFMSSNGFYWSLVSSKKKKEKHPLGFFKNAFQNYGDIICGPLTLNNINKINDNIFVFWVYIWTMSKVVKSYMQSGNITIPLQIDLVIIPNNTENDDNNPEYIDINIFERFQIHDQLFQYGICDPTKILSINQTLENVLTKCSNEIKQEHDNNDDDDDDDYKDGQNGRIIIIIDRRTRDEYNKNDNNKINNKDYDHIFAYKPPSKYSQIDEEHEILNAIWNTSKFIIPPPTNYKHEELSGAENNNLFILSYLIRKKSQFIHLFDKDEIDIDYDDDDLDDIESVYSEDSKSQTTRKRSLRTGTDITNRKFDSQVAREFVPSLRKHKELTTLMLVALFEKVAEKTKKAADPKELKELQDIQTFIMRLLMNRKRDSTVNTYLFYNKGYCRFEPLDLIRILPQFFNLNKILNYENMIHSFKTYHDKLWELDDLIWMEYKRLYLQSSNAMNQQISINTIGTDPLHRKEISKYCKWLKQKQITSPLSLSTPSPLSLKNIHKNIDSNKIMHLYEMVKLRSQKSLDLFRIIKKEKYIIEITLNIDLRKFLILSQKNKDTTHGIKIKQIIKNDYGDLFKETGINGNKGWYVNSIDKESIEYGTIRKFNNIMDEIIDLQQSYKVIFIRVKQKNNKSSNRKRTDSLIRPSHAKKSSLIRHKQSNTIHITQPNLQRMKSPQTLHIIDDHDTTTTTIQVSSKPCPNCGHYKDKPSIKVWRIYCNKCGQQWCWKCAQFWNNKSVPDVIHCGNQNCIQYIPPNIFD